MSSSLAMHGARRWIGLALALAGASRRIRGSRARGTGGLHDREVSRVERHGRGASFANAAHIAWETNFQNSFCADVGVFPDLTYDAAGSGAGRRVMGERTAPNADGSLSRNQVPRYGMTDEPPTTTAVSQMNQGTDAVGDEGHYPRDPRRHRARSCWPSTGPTTATARCCRTRRRPTRRPPTRIRSPTVCASRAPRRRRSGTVTRPTTSGTRSSRASPPTPECTGFITRIVRFDDSGTSFAFKAWLDKVNPTPRLGPGLHVRPRHA